jgi:hypothetical protein
MNEKTWWNFTVELLGRAYPLQQFACKWLKHSKFSDYWPHFTKHDEWTIAKYIMDVLRPI